MLTAALILSLIGLPISIYSYYIEHKVKEDTNYTAACDISDKISCTKATRSKYSKTFGISNSLMGIPFYSAMAIASYCNAPSLVGVGAHAAAALSLYLGYKLVFRVKTWCLLCTALYAVNGLLLASYYW